MDIYTNWLCANSRRFSTYTFRFFQELIRTLFGHLWLFGFLAFTIHMLRELCHDIRAAHYHFLKSTAKCDIVCVEGQAIS